MRSAAKTVAIPRGEPVQRRLARVIVPRLTRYIIHSPHPKQQAFLLLSHVPEVLFGGAAGGGKSDALLMAALQYVDVPGYNALILRNTFAQLAMAEGLMDRSQEWLGGTDAWWDADRKTWWFPSGARVTFGYLEARWDRYRYQSTGWQYIAFDELTDFRREDYLYLFSRQRRLRGVDIPLRMRAATNPGGRGHDWVKARFVDGAPAYSATGELLRVFVPARLEDNPSLDWDSYEVRLAQLDPVTHRQLRWGDWSVMPDAGMFQREFFTVIDRIPPSEQDGLQVVRFWDLAGTEVDNAVDADWTRGVKLGRSVSGNYYVLDVRGCRRGPAGVERMLRETAEQDGVAVPIYIEEEGGQAGRAQISYLARHVLNGFDVHGFRVSGSKEVRARPVASQFALGHVFLLAGHWNEEFINELCAFPTTGVHDDQVDALSGAFHVLNRAASNTGTFAQTAIPARTLRQTRRRA